MLLAFLATDEPGFGGAAAPSTSVELVPAQRRDDDPEQAALRGRLEAALEAQPTPAGVASTRTKRTKIEEEIERARLDPTLPLLAFRIEVAVAEADLEELTGKGARPEVVQAAEARVAALHEIAALVERIAVARLVRCTRATDREIAVKNYRMTAGGPVPLTTEELLQQLPTGDPDGCERINLIDAVVMAKARRLFAVRQELKNRSFGYHHVAERKALERELTELTKALEEQAQHGVSMASQRP